MEPDEAQEALRRWRALLNDYLAAVMSGAPRRRDLRPLVIAEYKRLRPYFKHLQFRGGALSGRTGKRAKETKPRVPRKQPLTRRHKKR